MTDPIVVPPLVAETVRSALVERDRRQGVAGMTRTAALTAAELAASPVTTPDVVRQVAAWHQQHPEHTTADGQSTVLGGVWGGRAGRDWALEMTLRLADPWVEPQAKTAAAQMDGAMIALYPDDPESLALDGGDPAEQLHLTIAFVAEDADTISDPTMQAVIRAAQAGSSVRSEPLRLTVVGYGQLGSADPPASVLIMQQADEDGTDHQDGAGAVAEVVRAELDDYGSEGFPPEHDAFIPHLTIGYGVPVDQLAGYVGRTVTFSAGVTLTLGGTRIDYPWGEARTAAIADPLPIIRDPALDKRRTRLRRLSKRLNRIDRDLQAALQGGAEHALEDALRRAGVKVTQRAQRRSKAVQASVELAEGRWTGPLLAAVGITEQEALAHAFDTYATQARKRVEEAQRRRLQAIADELELDADELEGEYEDRLAERRESAVGFLLAGLTSLAFARLADPDPGALDVGEAASSAVPLSLIYQATAISDGRPMDGPGADGPGTLGEGEVSVDPFGAGFTLEVVAANVDDVTEAITWEWGGAAKPFEPHLSLDGTSTTPDMIGEDWGKDPADFPYETGWYFPGDHAGCACAWSSELTIPGSEGE